MKILITGGAGFIGSTFADKALSKGHQVVVLDNLSTGRKSFLCQAESSPLFKFILGDIRDYEPLEKILQSEKPNLVVHFAANADVRFGLERTRRDLDYNTIGTWNIIESMRKSGCTNILFSSTGSVYGEPEEFPTSENCPFPVQTSLYAASKVAGENLISAYCHGFGMNALVFRFVSILGPRYTHGHVFDFVKQLKANPKTLKILGDGKQNKSYLHVEDLMAGLFLAIDKNLQGFNVFNIGHDSSLVVDESAKTICKTMGIDSKFEHSGGERGWVGDSPRIQLDTTKLKKLGWNAKHDLHSSVESTVKYLLENPFLMDEVNT